MAKAFLFVAFIKTKEENTKKLFIQSLFGQNYLFYWTILPGGGGTQGKCHTGRAATLKEDESQVHSKGNEIREKILKF